MRTSEALPLLGVILKRKDVSFIDMKGAKLRPTVVEAGKENDIGFRLLRVRPQELFEGKGDSNSFVAR